MRSIICLAAAVASFSACSGELVPGGGGASITDSAGVRMVQNTAPRWGAGEGWVVDSTPVVELRSGGVAPPLSQVQSARRLSDGRIAVIDGSTQQLRIYDASGQFVSASGARGTAPGQSRNLGALTLMRGDSLFAWDYLERRGLVYDERGTFVRHITPSLGASTYESPRIARAMEDGSFIGTASTSADLNASLRRNGSWEAYVRVSESGALVDTIGEYQLARCAELQQQCTAGPFGPIGLIALSDNRLYYGFSDTYDIRGYDLDGNLREVIRRQVEPVHVPTAFFDTLRAQWAAALRPDQHGALDRYMRDGDFGTIMPRFSSLTVDTEGNLWVGEVNEPYQMHIVFRSDAAKLRGPARPAYSVYDEKGAFLGSVSVPAGLHVYETGEDYVLGEWRGNAGEELVRLYRLSK